MDGLIQTWDFSSTGQVDQSVWITQAPGASDGQVLCQATIDEPFGIDRNKHPLPAVKYLPPGQVAVTTTPITAPGNYRAGPFTFAANYFATVPIAKSLPINPAEITNAGGVQYRYFIGTNLGTKWIGQTVSAEGTFSVVIKPAGGNDGTGGSDGTQTFTFPWTESYQADWSYYFTGSASTTYGFGVESDHVDHPANLVKALFDRNVKYVDFNLGGPTGLQLTMKNLTTNANTLYDVVSWTYQLKANYKLSAWKFVPTYSQSQYNAIIPIWNKLHPHFTYPGSNGTLQNYMWYDWKKATVTPNLSNSSFTNTGTLLPQDSPTVLQSVYWTYPALPKTWGPVGSTVATCNDIRNLSWDSTVNKGTVNASYKTSGYK